MNQAWWRKWHRWLGFVAAPFLAYAAITGFLLAVNEFFGEEEARRESLREVVSSVKLPADETVWSGPMAKAMATVAKRFPGSPVDKVTIEFKGERPIVTVYTGKPEGGEDRKFILDGHTGELLRTEEYEDKPFLVRVHSGEAWGDGGLVFAMLWALALLVAIFSGLVIYLKMRRPGLKGLGRIFWLVFVAVQFGLI
jgi:uncharacterized iron-regulated membrane protein